MLFIILYIGSFCLTPYLSNEELYYSKACEFIAKESEFREHLAWIENVSLPSFEREFVKAGKYRFIVSDEVISPSKKDLCQRINVKDCSFLKEYPPFINPYLNSLSTGGKESGHLVFFTKLFKNFLFCVITSKKIDYPCFELNHTGSRLEMVFIFGKDHKIKDYHIYKKVVDSRSKTKTSPRCK